MTLELPLKLIGNPGSPYTRKMVSFLRYKSIPYKIIWGDPGSILDKMEIEKANVFQIYSQIAKHFNNTRHYKWRSVEDFLDSLPHGSFVLDLGCGNGRNMENTKSEVKKSLISANLIDE